MENVELPDETSLQQALASAKATHGPEHYSVAYRLMQLGDLFESENRLSEAETAYLDAANIYRSLGADHELLCAIALKAAVGTIKRQGRQQGTSEMNGEIRHIILNHRPVE